MFEGLYREDAANRSVGDCLVGSLTRRARERVRDRELTTGQSHPADCETHEHKRRDEHEHEKRDASEECPEPRLAKPLYLTKCWFLLYTCVVRGWRYSVMGSPGTDRRSWLDRIRYPAVPERTIQLLSVATWPIQRIDLARFLNSSCGVQATVTKDEL